MIFSAYRRDDFADPDSFVLQLGMILSRYSDAVIAAISSPFTGLQRRLKKPPSIADIVEACDDEAAAIARIAEADKQPRPSFNRDIAIVKRHRANVLVLKGAPQHEAMMARAMGNADPLDYRHDGADIWVNAAWLWDLDERREMKTIGKLTAKLTSRA